MLTYQFSGYGEGSAPLDTVRVRAHPWKGFVGVARSIDCRANRQARVLGTVNLPYTSGHGFETLGT